MRATWIRMVGVGSDPAATRSRWRIGDFIQMKTMDPPEKAVARTSDADVGISTSL